MFYSRTFWKSKCTHAIYQKDNAEQKQECKQFKKDKRGVIELESISIHDLRTYVRNKQNQGLKPQSIVAMFKVIRAFFSW